MPTQFNDQLTPPITNRENQESESRTEIREKRQKPLRLEGFSIKSLNLLSLVFLFSQ